MWKLVLIAILITPAFAQPQGLMGLTFQGMQPFTFDLQTDPPSPPPRIHTSTSSRSASSMNGGEVVSHRYFFDEATRVYFGYDIQMDIGANSTYKISFYDLGIGPLDMMSRDVRGDPATWKKLALPAIPVPQVVYAGDTIKIEVGVEPATNQTLIDHIRIQAPNSMQLMRRIQSPTMGQIIIRGGGGPATERTIPTVSGPARTYSAEDAEMRLVQPRITINGVAEDTSGRAANASGVLVWFHVPNRGRFVLSLAPRPELGFVKTGEVRGGAVRFTLGKDEFLLESPTPVASGSSAYALYVLHDPDWEPTVKGAGDHAQFGSVAPGEIALLQKK